MRVETLVVGLLLGLGLLPVLRLGVRPAARGRATAALLGISVLAGGLAGSGLPPESSPAAVDRPVAVAEDRYVSSRTCRSCHPRAYATWHGSYHRTMTQVATPENVLGDFDRVIEHEGAVYRLGQTDRGPFVEMRGPRFPPGGVRRPVVLTTGSHHMQVYWYSTGRTRELAALPFVYLREDQRWVPRLSVFLTPPDQRAGPELGRWNSTCIKCHTTHGKPRIRGIGRLDTTVAEFGIACEACHGPAEEHVRVNRDPTRRYRYHLSGDADSTIVQPARLAGVPSSQVCGQCHGVTYFRNRASMKDFVENGFEFRPGDDLQSQRILARHGPAVDEAERVRRIREMYPSYREEDRFWSDGMVRVSGREFNGLVESPCYRGGEFECVSCHAMHKAEDDPRSIEAWANDQLKPAMDGDEACLGCHEKYRTRIAEHSHHETDSTGSRCYNCHMPYTTYGLMKAIRSHEVSNPTVDETLDTGRPNACNQCHLDQTLAWTADYLQRWYETPPPALDGEEATVAASVLWALEGDAGQRALAAWSMGWAAAREASGATWMPAYLAELLVDPYHTVRYIAGRSLRRIEGFERFDYDHMAPGEQLEAARRRALSAWSGMSTAKTAPHLLVDEDGRLRRDVVDELLERRNHRRMTLKE